MDVDILGSDDSEFKSNLRIQDEKFFSYFTDITFLNENEKFFFKYTLKNILIDKILNLKVNELYNCIDKVEIKRKIKKDLLNGSIGLNHMESCDLIEVYLKKRKIENLNKLAERTLEKIRNNKNCG